MKHESPAEAGPLADALNVEAKRTGFLRLERAALPWHLPFDDRGALLSLVALCDSRDNGYLEGSAATFGAVLGVHRTTMQRRLKSLEAAGELELAERGRGQDHPSIYRVVRFCELTGYPTRIDGPLTRRVALAALMSTGPNPGRADDPLGPDSLANRPESGPRPAHIRAEASPLPAATEPLDVDRRERRRARAREEAAEEERSDPGDLPATERFRELARRNPWAKIGGA